MDELRRHRFNVRQFHPLIDVGILPADNQTELIDGIVVDVAREGPLHQSCVDRLAEEVSSTLSDEGMVRVRGSLRLSDDCELSPDLAILRRRSGFSSAADAVPSDVLSIVEVSAATLPLDLDVKVPVYAKCRVPEVWVVDIKGQRILVHRQPTPSGYGRVLEVGSVGQLSPEGIPHLRVRVADIFG